MAYGNSTYGQNHKDWADPIASIKQVNSMGPQIWAAVSTILFNIMREDGVFASIVSMVSHHKLDISGFAFVDNTDLIATQSQGEMEDIQTKIAKIGDTLERAIKSIRGALVPDKCFWY